MAQVDNTLNPQVVEVVYMTKYGGLSFSTLQALNGNKDIEDLDEETRNMIASDREFLLNKNRFSMQDLEPQYMRSPYADTSTPFGKSRYDPDFLTHDNLNRIQDIRANNQPWFGQVVNGEVKGVIKVGTTFVNGTVGVIWGLVNIAKTVKNMDYEKKEEHLYVKVFKMFSAFWDNEVTRRMKEITKWAEREIPNYRTDAEVENYWETFWEHPGNFIGEDLSKVLGFIIGAGMAGKVWLVLFQTVGRSIKKPKRERGNYRISYR